MLSLRRISPWGHAMVVVLVFAFAFISTARAQTKTLDRMVDPVIVSGQQFEADFFQAPLNELGVFAFDAATQTWRAIPFQIDERNSAGQFVFPGEVDDVAGLDGNDELVFMAEDAGDQAFIWLNDPGSQQFVRHEIVVSDTSDPANVKQGWVYLYRSTTFALAKPGVEDYVSYTPSANPQTGEDLVEGQTYKLAGTDKGLLGDLFLPADPQADLLTGQELRGKAQVIFTLTFSELDLGFLGVRAIDGSVRVIREVTLDLLGELAVPLPAQYFKYSMSMGGIINIPQDIKIGPISASIKELRHSLNFTSAVTGGFFASQNNINIPVDGNPDVINDDLVFQPEFNFIHLSGAASTLAKPGNAFTGTVVNLFSLPNTIGDKQKLFYEDEAGNNQFGDSGVFVSGDDIEGEFPLALELTFFAENTDRSVGQQLAFNARHPLKAESAAQDFSSVPVELVSFTAVVFRNRVTLEWVTASETNNFGFEVERRTGEEAWGKIGFVEGHGTTTVPNRYRFVDRALRPGGYEYRLKQIDTDGTFEYSGVLTAVVGLPERFALHPNFPNPFNPETEIRYEIPAGPGTRRRTVLQIYNLLGQLVRTLVDRTEPAGFYAVKWDGRDEFGRQVPSGVYIYRLRSGNEFSATRKMTLVR